MIPIIKELRELGIHISVDDFGTGYSSLAYIKELPIDTLKIDRSFVRDIHMNKESKEIAKAIINLANSIGLNVIAEGVEQQEHVDALSKDGCILGQGYYYSRPLKVDAFEGYMASNNISWVMNSEAEKIIKEKVSMYNIPGHHHISMITKVPVKIITSIKIFLVCAV